VKVRLPDGSELELEDGATGADAARSIGAGLARAALAVRANGDLQDLSAPLEDGATIEIVTPESPEDGDGPLWLVRHDAAHVLATAVRELYPGTKISIGPPIDTGFYYDFEFPEDVKVSDADLERIEQAMSRHIAADEPFEREDVPAAEAIERFRSEGEDYKVELIEDLVRDDGVETVSLYTNGPFTDLCRGPHGPGTKRVKAVKLLSVAGAYWRGDETRQMLTRIYGTAFFSKKDLDAHLKRLEEARARDHRRLGRELGLFLLREEAPGMPFWLPAGMTLQNGVQAAVREQLEKRGYVEIKTPHVLDEELWHRSGHWDNYRDAMYFTEAEERRFALKPMNCPGACLVYGSERRSYRDLPMRLAEFGLCSRREREGVLHGLLRVRAFVQDDAHVYCTEEQIEAEVADICRAIDELYSLFGFDSVRVELSTRPDKSIGSPEAWKRAEAALAAALDGLGKDYELKPGEGAFYGPKIDFHVTDALGRSWQCGTCQLDFFMPERFDLSYAGADNAEHRPVMIHRALLGSVERFIGILIEHHAGEFPLWLAPMQALVLPIADRHVEYAQHVADELRAGGLRVAVDARSESVGKKIRDGELHKARYMLVVGDKEEESGRVAVRRHREGDTGTASVQEFVQRAREEVDSRA
jgi:threonyl-tRNA synthetase